MSLLITGKSGFPGLKVLLIPSVIIWLKRPAFVSISINSIAEKDSESCNPFDVLFTISDLETAFF